MSHGICLDWCLNNPSYLSGFKAQRYQISLEDGFEHAKPQIVEGIRLDVMHDIGGDEQRINSVSTTYSDITFKHILLPVWITSYRFSNRQYQVVVNAQTGKVMGDRPISLQKVSLAVLVSVAAIAGFLGVRVYLSNPASLPSISTPSIDLPFPDQSAPFPSPNSSSTPSHNFSSNSPPTSSPTSSANSSDDSFRRAINTANLAVSRTQSAKTQQDWQQIANLWEQAIIAMTAVPSSSANYATAQQKAIEYQRYLNYARQQVRNSD